MKNGIDFTKITTFPAAGRKNLVTIKDILDPTHLKNREIQPPESWKQTEEFAELVNRIREAKKQGKPVVWSLGGHVIKRGLSRYLIALMKNGFVNHVTGNGSVSIHDFEMAFLGGTSEDVATAIEDGSFGMWEETGRWMNRAVQSGYRNGLGYGESLAAYVAKHRKHFPYKDFCVFYQAYLQKIPATYHVAIGTDFIHQHPIVDFAAIGGTSGVDFKKYCQTISRLEGGVFLNFGSAVIGPEVFLKALSIVRNLGFKVKNFTTANFDLFDLYRPRMNVVRRPVSLGGKGFNFFLDHRISIPFLYNRLTQK
ncbi:MAG: hypothetical protein WC081_03300 [Candidatus Ratteibacteria bacterium]|jgi:hypothetical protein